MIVFGFSIELFKEFLAPGVTCTKTNIAHNPICIYCKSAPETIDHLFIHCSLVLDFWEQLRVWLYIVISLHIELLPLSSTHYLIWYPAQ